MIGVFVDRRSFFFSSFFCITTRYRIGGKDLYNLIVTFKFETGHMYPDIATLAKAANPFSDGNGVSEYWGENRD